MMKISFSSRAFGNQARNVKKSFRVRIIVAEDANRGASATWHRQRAVNRRGVTPGHQRRVALSGW